MQVENIQVIGVDQGNRNIKTASSVVPNGIMESDTIPALAKDILRYNDRYYALSYGRQTYTRDKTQGDEFLALTLMSICRELRYRGYANDGGPCVAEVILALDLPIEHYRVQKEKHKDFFEKRLGNAVCEFDGVLYRIHVRLVDVYPQGFAALMSNRELLQRHDRLCVVDIGGYQVNTVMMKKDSDGESVPVMKYCRTFDMGIIPLLTEIKRNIDVSFDMKIDDSVVEDILSGKERYLPEEIRKMAYGIAEKYVDGILGELYEAEINLKTTPFLLVGGGSIMLLNWIRQSKRVSISAMFVEEDIRANARGAEWMSLTRTA